MRRLFLRCGIGMRLVLVGALVGDEWKRDGGTNLVRNLASLLFLSVVCWMLFPSFGIVCGLDVSSLPSCLSLDVCAIPEFCFKVPIVCFFDLARFHHDLSRRTTDGLFKAFTGDVLAHIPARQHMYRT